MEMEDTYQLVSIDSIVSSSFVIVDVAKDNYPTHVPGISKYVYVVLKQQKWHLHFIDYNNKSILRDGKECVDLEYPLGNVRHIYEG